MGVGPYPELHLRQGLLSDQCCRHAAPILPSTICWHYFLQRQRTPALSRHLTSEHSSSSLLTSLRRSLSLDIGSHLAVAAAATAALRDVTEGLIWPFPPITRVSGTQGHRVNASGGSRERTTATTAVQLNARHPVHIRPVMNN